MDVQGRVTAGIRDAGVIEEQHFKLEGAEDEPSITSHSMEELSSSHKSLEFSENGVPFPAQITIEVQEKPYHEGEGANETRSFSKFKLNSLYSRNIATVYPQKRKSSYSKLPNVKRINTGTKISKDKIIGCIKDDENNHFCYFCRTSFLGGLKVMHIVLNKQLPSSSLDPLSLLRCFGMQFPKSKRVEQSGFSPVDICGKCYMVISDCDILYPHLYAAINKILEVWPEKMEGMRTLSLNVNFGESENCNSKDKKKLSLPDVQLSFAYLMLSNSDSNADFESCSDKIASRKIVSSEVFTCCFCGLPFGSEEHWSDHIAREHKVISKWQSYNLQSGLKRFINKDVQWLKKEKFKEDAETDGRKCCACNKDFQNRDKYIDHLHTHHNIVTGNTQEFGCENDDIIHKVQANVNKDIKVEATVFDEDQMSAYSDGSEGSAFADIAKSKIHSSKVKQADIAKNPVMFTGLRKNGSEVEVKKVYAPHWRCRLCGMLFSSHEVLSRHKIQSHPEAARIIKKKVFEETYDVSSAESRIKRELRCPVCNQFVESPDALKEHLHVIHQKYMVCLDKKSLQTSEKFTGKEKFRTPRKGKGTKIRPQPPKDNLGYCVVLKGDGQGGISDHRLKIDRKELEKIIPEKVEVKSETVSPDDNKKVLCGMCGEEFASRILMAEHSCSVREDAEVHDPKGNNESTGENEIVMLECKLCGRRLHGVNALRIHKARVHGDPYSKNQYKHRCKVCSFQTRLRSQFYKHMKESHSIDIQPPVKCFICGKMYNSTYIARHIAVVHGTTGNKKYSCKFCDMKYHDLVYLKRHVYFDHANTKWKCQVCQLEFERYHQLRQHRVNVHGTDIHKCSDCEKTFKRKGDLTTHRKRRHQTKVPAVCSFCSKAYSEPSKLRIHLIEKHEVPWENTLSQRYARHQQENNCLKRHGNKEGKTSTEDGSPGEPIKHRQIHRIKTEAKLHKSESSYEDESEEDCGQVVRHEYSEEMGDTKHYPQGEIVTSQDNVITAYGTTQVSNVHESDYNVVEVTEADENMDNIGEISYIIYEEPNT